jgi:ABC-2 type transport system ATP-binding protein
MPFTWRRDSPSLEQMTAAIETHELAKGYGKTQALYPLTISVPAGAVFALVGHNGAGKTTLIKMLMNMIHPSSGSATILGKSTVSLTGEDFTRIGYASENQELPDWMTVGQFMQYLRGFYPSWDDAALIRQLELPLDRKLKHLSRGMLMKAALASILAFQPNLILLDEPFSGLDPLVRDELIEALMSRTRPRSLAGEEALVASGASRPTVLISSHDLAEVESFATHIGFLHQGRLLFSEEMSSLTARFREITLTLPPPAPGEPAAAALARVKNPPASWLLFESTPTAARFIHAHADTEPVQDQIAEVFGGARPHLAEAPMTLRAIFLALAKSGKTPAVPDEPVIGS